MPDPITEVAAWRSEARALLPCVRHIAKVLSNMGHTGFEGDLDEICDRLQALLDDPDAYDADPVTPVPGHPRHGNRKGFSSSYTVREASLPTFPRALR